MRFVARHASKSRNTISMTQDQNSLNTALQPSEKDEGKPYAEWIVATLVIVSAVLGALGFTFFAVSLLALLSFSLGGLRLKMGQRSPWKVRSVGFDAFICLSLGAGLLLTYFSILLIL